MPAFWNRHSRGTVGVSDAAVSIGLPVILHAIPSSVGVWTQCRGKQGEQVSTEEDYGCLVERTMESATSATNNRTTVNVDGINELTTATRPFYENDRMLQQANS